MKSNGTMNQERTFPQAAARDRAAPPRGEVPSRTSGMTADGAPLLPQTPLQEPSRFRSTGGPNLRPSPPSEPSSGTEIRKPPLLLGRVERFPAGSNGQAKEKSGSRSPTDSISFGSARLNRLSRWAGSIMVGVSFLYLAVRAVPTLATASWWQAESKARQSAGLREEGEALLDAVRTIDRELAGRVRLGPILAAVAFSSVPTLLVDEVEVLTPFSTQTGRVRVKIRSYDSDWMAALATFGAMVGMAFERSTGRKIRLNPSGLRIPDSLDRGETGSVEPIRATLTAPLRWEDLR